MKVRFVKYHFQWGHQELLQLVIPSPTKLRRDIVTLPSVRNGEGIRHALRCPCQSLYLSNDPWQLLLALSFVGTVSYIAFRTFSLTIFPERINSKIFGITSTQVNICYVLSEVLFFLLCHIRIFSYVAFFFILSVLKT